jgi:hypothetical protein
MYAVFINVETIRMAYNSLFEEDEAKDYAYNLQREQMRDLCNLYEMTERRKEAARAKHYPPCAQENEPTSHRHQPVRSREQIIDIDQIGLQHKQRDASQSDFQRNRHQLPHPATRRRQPTEDIPAPTQDQWSEDEIIVLLNALQKFRSRRRFEHILNAYGTSGGTLERFDMDRIIQQSKWLKQSMATSLANVDDSSWDWLRSVPE